MVKPHMSRLMTKPTKWHVRPAKTQISLGIRPVSSESSLSTWRKLGSLATHWAHSEDSNQTGRMPRLIWVFAGSTLVLLVLSWGGSFVKFACNFSHICDTYSVRFGNMKTSLWISVMLATLSHKTRANVALDSSCFWTRGKLIILIIKLLQNH